MKRNLRTQIITGIVAALVCCFSNTITAQNFTVIDSLPLGAYGAAAWGDFDNDGFKDLAYLVQSAPTDICKIYHNVNNVFTEVNQYFPVLYNPSVKWADLNNDGWDDLVMNGADSVLVNVTRIFQSNGNGTFTPIANNIIGLTAGSVAVADYNNDGIKDIAVTGFDNFGMHHAYIYKGLGNWSYVNINATLEGIHFGEMQWGNYNNDSLPDLVINGIGDTDFRTRIYQNMGADSFAVQPIYIKGSGGTVDWVDVDQDGWNDIFVTGYDSTSSNSFTELNHNNGNGTFTIIPTSIPDCGEPSGVAIADFNNDLKPDICMIGGMNFLPTYYSELSVNLGNNTFNNLPLLHVDVLNSVAEAADIDSDGDFDLLLNNYILRNDGPSSLSNADNNNFSTHIFPNPVLIEMEIVNNTQMKSIQVVDVLGKQILMKEVSDSKYKMDCTQFPAGTYTLVISNSDASIQHKKFIIVRR